MKRSCGTGREDGTEGAPPPQGTRREPWQRLREESVPAFRAFALYRDLGERRSVAAAARAVGKHPALLYRWHARHRWAERVRAWDEREQEEEDETATRARAEARERRLRNAEQLERVAMAGLRTLMVRDPETGEARFDKRLKPGEIAALIRVAAQIFPTPTSFEEECNQRFEISWGEPSRGPEAGICDSRQLAEDIKHPALRRALGLLPPLGSREHPPGKGRRR